MVEGRIRTRIIIYFRHIVVGPFLEDFGFFFIYRLNRNLKGMEMCL